MPGENEFDINAAADQIGADLGLELDDTGDALETGSEEPKGRETSVEGVAGVQTPAEQPGATAEPSPAPAPTDPLLSAPKTWKADAAAQWAALPEGIRAEIHRREENMFAGIEQYKQDAGLGRQFIQSIQQYIPTLQQYGIDPFQQVRSLMEAHHTLALGSPQQKAAMLRRLDHDYKLGIFDQAGQQLEAPFLDPAVANLQSQLQDVNSRLENRERQEAAARQSSARTAVEAFASDPKNQYFDECSNEIAMLVQQALPLADAYERAIWLNPGTRAKEIARLNAAQVASAEAERKANAAKAAAGTAGKPRASAKPSGPAAAVGSLDETLAEQLAAIKARNS